VFSALALALAAIGIFGVMHSSVAHRTHEIGVRMALGARATDVFGMVIRQGLLLAGAGVGVGILGALWLTQALSGMLYARSMSGGAGSAGNGVGGLLYPREAGPPG